MSNTIDMFPVNDGSCRALWLGVVHQALEDLISNDESYEGLINSGCARRWFFFVNSSFPMVCQLAGLNPYAVRKRAREIRDNPSLFGQSHV